MTLAAAGPALAQTPPRPLVESFLERLTAVGDAVERSLTGFFSFLPRSVEGVGAATAALRAGADPGGTLMRTLVVLALASGVAALVYILTQRLRRRAILDSVPVRGAFALLALDLLAAVAGALVIRIGVVRVLDGLGGDLILARAVLFSVGRTFIAITVLLFLLRPDCERFRLFRLTDEDARRLTWSIAGLMLFGTLLVNVTDALHRIGMPLPTAQLAYFTGTLVILAWALVLARSPPGGGIPGWLLRLTRALIVLVAVVWAGAVLIQDYDLYLGLVRTLGAVLVAVTVDRLFVISMEEASSAGVRRLTALRMIAGAIALAVIARIIAELWLHGTFGWISVAAWPAFSRALTSASLVLIVGLAIVMALNAHVEATLERARAGGAPEAYASRVTTLLPGVKLLGAAAIMTITSLVALSELGIDIAPLIAGAGIFGLAISFGSQALVRDIVAGIFFMVDDTFRLGEHVEAAGQSGIITRITLRTINLRDKRGQLHTIPLGSIGVISNNSRGQVRLDLVITLYGAEALGQIAAIENRLAPLLAEGGALAALFRPGSIEVSREGNEAGAVYELSAMLPAAAHARAEEILTREVRAVFTALGLKPTAEALSLTRSDAGTGEAARSAV